METQTFADILATAMAKKKLTDFAAAKLIGVTPSCVCLWRQGRATPSMKYGVALCRELGVSAAKLMTACEKAD
jgi:DNA-binding XRE family transcriptional regulator